MGKVRKSSKQDSQQPATASSPAFQSHLSRAELYQMGKSLREKCPCASHAAGKATIRYEFAYDGGGLAKGGVGTIVVNGEKVAEGRIERTQPMAFSADGGADVGEDGETPVVEDYGIAAPYRFTGKIAKVTVDLKEMKAAEKATADTAHAEADYKKALSD